jgi:TRAP transporter 4TM/12TM fusion protein
MRTTRHERKTRARREFSGFSSFFINGLGVFTTIVAILYVSNVSQYFGIYVMRHSYLGIILSLFLTQVFLLYPATKRGPYGKVPWYDYVLIAAAVSGPMYYAIVYPSEMMRMDASLLSPFEMVLTLASVITILEATRRVMGLAMPFIAALFFVHAVTCQWWPSFLHGRGYDLARVTTQAYLSHFGVFGIAFNVAATIIIVFVLFGRILNLTGAGNFINAFALSVLGRVRGGPAKVAVVGSGLFGSISGLATANIATTGSFTIPMMKKGGYRPYFAAAVEAAASNGGQILPPVMGLIAFLMADWLGEPYYRICLAAAIPAVLYYIAIFVAVDGEAVSLGLKGLPRSEVPSFSRTIADGWEYVLPPVGLVVLIGVLAHSPQIAGLYASILAVIVALFKKKDRKLIGFAPLMTSLRDGTVATLMPACACACVGIIMGSLGLTGLGVKLSAAVVDASGGILFVLLVLSAICSFILGMGVGMIPSYMMVAALVAPALVKVGVPEIAAHLFVFYFAIVSMLTPPVAVAAYLAAGIAGSDPWKTGWTAARLGIVKYIVPFLFIYSPALIGQGTSVQVFIAGTSGAFGTILLAWALSGYSIKRGLSWWEKIMCGIGAFCFFYPEWQVKAVGIFLVIPVMFIQFRREVP